MKNILRLQPVCVRVDVSAFREIRVLVVRWGHLESLRTPRGAILGEQAGVTNN